MLIVFEGADGVGKTTHADRLATRLAEAFGRDVVRLSEPTDGPWGRKIREAARSGNRPAPDEEARWFTEDRREDVAHNIRPALQAGKIVVLDRYFYSTAAYQSSREGGPSRAQILAENRAFAPEPDLCLLLTLPAQDAQRRIHSHRDPDAFEALDYQQQVAKAFAELAQEVEAEGRCAIATINTAAPVEQVDQAIWQALTQHAPQLFEPPVG